MQIRWRGHASFVIEVAGKRIVTDPFNAELGYPLAPILADIVTVSHDHWDHNAVETVSGHPQIIRGFGTQETAGIRFQGIASYHDRSQGRERGTNTIFKLSAEGMSLVHLGDLGHRLSAEQVGEIGKVDILILPVGGRYTIDAAEAVKVVAQLQPKIVIPMHYATPHLSFALDPLELFTAHFDQVIKKPYLEVQPDDLRRAAQRVIVLEYLSG